MSTPAHVGSLKRKLGEMMTVIDQAAEDETMNGKSHLDLCNLHKTAHEVVCGLQEKQIQGVQAHRAMDKLRERAFTDYLTAVLGSRALILEHVKVLEELLKRLAVVRVDKKLCSVEEGVWTHVPKLFESLRQVRESDERAIKKHEDTCEGLKLIRKAYWKAFAHDEKAEALDSAGRHDEASVARAAGLAVATELKDALDGVSSSEGAPVDYEAVVQSVREVINEVSAPEPPEGAQGSE